MKPSTGSRRAIDAILNNWDQWYARNSSRKLTYRITQMLIGHGCFGECLHKIGAEDTAECCKCRANLATTQHTLKDCPAYEERRAALKRNIGNYLSPTALVRAILKGEKSNKEERGE